MTGNAFKNTEQFEPIRREAAGKLVTTPEDQLVNVGHLQGTEFSWTSLSLATHWSDVPQTTKPWTQSKAEPKYSSGVLSLAVSRRA